MRPALARCVLAACIVLALPARGWGRPGSFVAYSLNAAEKQVRGGSHASDRALTECGGITHLAGMVYDEQLQDWILVGQTIEGYPPVTLDDLSVALRAVLLHNKAPLVSIDATPDTPRTHKQVVRYVGGIEHTQLGSDMVEQDILLKRMALGAAPTGTDATRSYVELRVGRAQRVGWEDRIGSRFWFKNRRPSLAIRDNVFAILDLEVAVETEVLYAEKDGRPLKDLAAIKDDVGDLFSSQMTVNLEAMGRAHPVLKRARCILALVSIAEGMRQVRGTLNVDFWLRTYPVRQAKTPTHFDLITTQREIEGRDFRLQVSGGLELNPIVVRLKKGHPSAFRDAVLKSRPSPGALLWHPPLRGWHVPGAEDVEDADATAWRSSEGAGFSLDSMLLKPASHREPRASLLPGYPAPPLNTTIPSFRIERAESPSSLPVGDIGGVMLHQTASVGGLEAGDIQASCADGDFSLIVSGSRVKVTRRQLREFVTALWAVYYGECDPGISIDPIEPGGKKHLVRYIGSVVNTDLGEVMREADYLAKQWAVGVNMPGIPGLKSIDDLAAERGFGWRYLGAGNRIWFVPEAVRFRRCGDALLFQSGHMTLKTEYRVLEGKAARAEPAAEAFAAFFTDHYDEIAARFPVFQKLFEYAKLVALAKFLKENGVPLHAFLLAHKDLILTAESPGTVDAFHKDSTHWAGVSIEGGVNLGCRGTYVRDAAAAEALRQALAKMPRAQVVPGRPHEVRQVARPAAGPTNVELGKARYTVLPAQSLARGAGKLPERFQTDVALRRQVPSSEPGGEPTIEPSIELVRHYDPDRKAPGAFGRGWDLLLPYALESTNAAPTGLLNVPIPEELAIVDRLSGRREVLAFSGKVLNAAGYVPDDPRTSPNVGLYIMSDGSLRLLDKTHREFWFDPQWRLTNLLLSHKHRFGLSYDAAGRVVALRDGDECCVRLKYRDARVVEAELPDGGKVRYAYEGDLLTRVTYPDGRELKLAYDAAGQFIQVASDLAPCVLAAR